MRVLDFLHNEVDQKIMLENLILHYIHHGGDLMVLSLVHEQQLLFFFKNIVEKIKKFAAVYQLQQFHVVLQIHLYC